MKVHAYFVLAAALALAGCGDDTTSKSKSTNSTSSGNPITAPVDYLDAVDKAHKSAVKSIDLSQLKNAIQMFNAAEGRFPKDLDELVATHYLGQIPKAPYKMKITYDATTGTAKVVPQ